MQIIKKNMEENIVNRIYEDIQKSNEPKRYWLYGVSGRYMKAVEVCNKLKIKPYIKFVERAWDKYVEPESGKNVVIINVTTPEELSNIGKFLDKWMNYSLLSFRYSSIAPSKWSA